MRAFSRLIISVPAYNLFVVAVRCEELEKAGFVVPAFSSSSFDASFEFCPSVCLAVFKVDDVRF